MDLPPPFLAISCVDGSMNLIGNRLFFYDIFFLLLFVVAYWFYFPMVCYADEIPQCSSLRVPQIRTIFGVIGMLKLVAGKFLALLILCNEWFCGYIEVVSPVLLYHLDGCSNGLFPCMMPWAMLLRLLLMMILVPFGYHVLLNEFYWKLEWGS